MFLELRIMLTLERFEAKWEGKGLNVSRAMVPGGWLVFIVHARGRSAKAALPLVSTQATLGTARHCRRWVAKI